MRLKNKSNHIIYRNRESVQLKVWKRCYQSNTKAKQGDTAMPDIIEFKAKI